MISTRSVGAVVLRRRWSAGSTVCVWRCVQRMASSGRRKGEVTGPDWRSPGSTCGALEFLARRRVVPDCMGRRPPPAGVCEARSRMQFATRGRVDIVMAGGRVAWPVALGGGEHSRPPRAHCPNPDSGAGLHAIGSCATQASPFGPTLARPPRASGHGQPRSRRVRALHRSGGLIAQRSARRVVL